MRVITKDFRCKSRLYNCTIVPLGDIHIGAEGCDEKKLARIIKRIADDENCYWVGLGDYADFINLSDGRFDPLALADWVSTKDLADLPRAQLGRFLEFVRPIASKCLGLAQGNHELTIQKKYERNIYSDIVTEVKAAAKLKADDVLGLGFAGWLNLIFRRYKNGGVGRVVVSVHHGFVGGRLAGAKALNMQRWLWTHACDLAIFGHSHNTAAQIEAVEGLDRNGNLETTIRHGMYSGSFLKSTVEGVSTYSEVKGYFPLPLTVPEARIWPVAKGGKIIKVLL